MSELIIGHASHDSARIWIRGDARRRFARIRLESPEQSIASGVLELGADDDFTHAEPFDKLDARTVYEVRARFAATPRGLDTETTAEELEGRLRTFPAPGCRRRFSFLLGSCNLSIVSLSNLGALAAGGLGTLAATQSLERKAEGGVTWRLLLALANGLVRLAYAVWFAGQVVSFPFRWLVARARGRAGPAVPKWSDKASLVYATFLLVYEHAGFKLKAPFLPRPYQRLCQVVENGLDGGEPPAFMIHAGDQIYFDFPFPQREPTLAAYRRAYREAWFEDEQLRKLLTCCPHFMMLDDHEIVDGFALDAALPQGRSALAYLEPAKRAYQEYAGALKPPSDGSLSYAFDYGASHFFVMDTRTRRCRGKREMIDPQQLVRFEKWLGDNPDGIRFVVSSVPFVAEVASSNAEGSGADDREDKWTGPAFRAQREEILRLLHQDKRGRIVFLVGDMHCCYHARMQIGWPHERITIHELAAGPIYQLQFGTRDQFLRQSRGFVDADGKLPFRTSLDRFHGSASGALHLGVTTEAAPEVRWRVVRTSPDLDQNFNPRPLSGRIRFEESRHT